MQIQTLDLDAIISKETPNCDGHLRLKRRVRFACGKKEISELFVRLTEAQGALDSLMKKSEKVLESQSQVTDFDKVNAQYLCRHINAIHAVLTRTLQCSVHVAHRVNLRVECRRILCESREESNSYNR